MAGRSPSVLIYIRPIADGRGLTRSRLTTSAFTDPRPDVGDRVGAIFEYEVTGIGELLNLRVRHPPPQIIEVAHGEDRIAQPPHQQRGDLHEFWQTCGHSPQGRHRRVIVFQRNVSDEIPNRTT
jgi:hypothetical protein